VGTLDPADSRLAEKTIETGPGHYCPDADQAETTERMRRAVAHLIVSNPTAPYSASSRPNRVEEQPG
jgi:hypothetical protein